MIYGVGIDLVEIERVRTACEKEHFRERIFRPEELLEAGGRARRLAADFAVKEAVSKALRTGFRGFGPWDIACLRDEKGAPYVLLYGGAGELSESLGITHIHVSITDTDTQVMALAVAEM